MSAFKDLPFLLQLLDDDSQTVQQEVQQAMRKYGRDLSLGIQPYLENLPEPARGRVFAIWDEIRKEIFEQNWLEWLDITHPAHALEKAYSHLALLNASLEDPPLEQLLDELAQKFYELDKKPTIPLLMRFLFIHQEYRPPKEKFYHPRNSDLVQVIRRKEGLQISLSALAILVGQRLDLTLHGFNMPRHFMIMSQVGEATQLFDPFNKGQALPIKGVKQLETALAMRKSSLEAYKAQPLDIIKRVLRNLINAHIRNGNQLEKNRYKNYLKTLTEAVEDRDSHETN